MMTNDDDIVSGKLDNLFKSYRAACPEVEAGANFMPGLWRKIESRHGFWANFQMLARTAMTACAALALLLLALNFVGVPQNTPAPSYTDALMADHSAEKTYYAETIRRHSVEPSPELDPAR